MEENEIQFLKEKQDAEPDQLAEITQTYEAQRQKEQEEYNQNPNLPYETRDYVVCMDTCGSEKLIS